MAFPYEKYIRASKFPHILCAGCGHGTIMKAMIRAIDKCELDKDKVCVVSGIGCSSRVPGYVDFNTLHTTHGRSLGFATGIKLANPELNIVAVSGDGDCAAIGGNHFIHACRRNINMTLIIFNNYIYGMTGGQYSPTTPEKAYAATAPYGNIESPFDLSELAKAAGATYVARTTIFHVAVMEKYIVEGIKHKGFSVIEIVTSCHTGYGRKNKLKTGLDFIKYAKANAVSLERSKTMKPEELEGKIITGVFQKVARESYLDRFMKIVERYQPKKDKKEKIEK